MGGHSFEDYGIGKTPTKAYNRAVEQAEHEFGHDGYNGTISTTHGCNVVEQPTGMKLDDFVAMAFLINEEEGEPLLRDIRKPPRLQRGANAYQRQAHHVQWQAAARWQKLPDKTKDEIRMAARFEKWGCCTCVVLQGVTRDRVLRDAGSLRERGDNAYLFFGIAAS